MKKIHTKVKRLFKLPTHKAHYAFFHLKAATRPKTFSTQEAAHTWASARNLSGYSLKSVKHNKRFQIVISNGTN